MNFSFFIILIAAKFCAADANLDEVNVIESLNQVKTLQVLGDSITIVSKNRSDTNVSDTFDQYLNNHIVRIKSPLQEDTFYDFEMKDLVPYDDEGRGKKRKGIRDFLLPILLAVKHKFVLIAATMAAIAFVAFKGLWAGLTALLISKMIALALLYKSQFKEKDDNEDQDEYHEHYYNHQSHHDSQDRQDRYSEPIVIYLNTKKNFHKVLPRIYEPPISEYKGSEAWLP